MSKQVFFKGLFWLLLLNILIKPLWVLAIDRQVQNLVGYEVYGTYFSLLSLAVVLLFLADAGLTTMMTQRVAGRMLVNTRQLLKIKLSLLLLYFIIGFLIGWLSGVSQWKILFYTMLVQALGNLLLFLRGILSANQLYKTDAWFSVIDKSLMLLLCGYFIYGWWQTIRLETFLQLQVVSVALACLSVFVALLRKQLLVKGNSEKLGNIIQWMLPFAAIILLMGAHYRLDAFLLERIRPDGARQSGIYATAYRLLDAANMVGYLTGSFLVPFIARHKDNRSLLGTVVTYSQHFLVLLGIVASCFAFVFAPWLQDLLYHTNASYNSRVIQLCLAVLPAYYFIHIYGSVLTAMARFKPFITILSISVAVNVSLNLTLVPAYGALGSCIAALVSQYGCAIACYAAVRKLALPALTFKHWLVYLLVAACLVAVLFMMRSAFHSVWTILAVAGLLIGIIALTQAKFLKTLLHSFIQPNHA
jgi:O-antigen/teichoic acid export membrane protein